MGDVAVECRLQGQGLLRDCVREKENCVRVTEVLRQQNEGREGN